MQPTRLLAWGGSVAGGRFLCSVRLPGAVRTIIGTKSDRSSFNRSELERREIGRYRIGCLMVDQVGVATVGSGRRISVPWCGPSESPRNRRLQPGNHRAIGLRVNLSHGLRRLPCCGLRQSSGGVGGALSGLTRRRLWESWCFRILPSVFGCLLPSTESVQNARRGDRKQEPNTRICIFVEF